MAGTRKGAEKVPDSAAKDIQSPVRGVKRKLSIGGLFNRDRNVKRRTDDEEAHGPASGFFARFSSKRKERHPAYQSFSDAAKKYQDGAAASGSEQLEPVFEELTARVRGMDINGRLLHIPGIPTAAELDILESRDSAMTESIEDRKLLVKVKQANGTIATKDITLREYMESVRRSLRAKAAEAGRVQEEAEQVAAQIRALADDVWNDRDGFQKKIQDKLESDLAAYREKKAKFEEQSEAEAAEMKSQNQAESVETNRKIQEFLKALQ